MTVRPFLFIIAGGSGSGKTTLAEGLIARAPMWTLIHLDDYQKPAKEVPMLGRWRNWDHPDAIDFPALVRDLQALELGESVAARARSRANQTIVPGPSILLEGFLALWHPEIREMMDYAIFLDAPHDVRIGRRRWKKDPGYVKNVLEPMHRLHVEPTKAYAELIMNVGSMTPLAMLDLAEYCLMPGG